VAVATWQLRCSDKHMPTVRGGCPTSHSRPYVPTSSRPFLPPPCRHHDDRSDDGGERRSSKKSRRDRSSRSRSRSRSERPKGEPQPLLASAAAGCCSPRDQLTAHLSVAPTTRPERGCPGP
jgi:hypothetical protein